MTEARPWYREPMVWMVIAIPATAVVVGLSMLGYSIASYDGLVVDDYYKQGKTINRRLERQQKSAELALSARITFLPDRQQLIVTLDSNADFIYPQTIQLNFHHSTRANLDISGELVRSGDRTYVSTLRPLAPGKWYVTIENDEWKLTDVLQWRGVGQELTITAS